MISIKQITSKETLSVRHPVLRKGKPIESCVFDGDDLVTTVHYGLYVEEQIVGVVSGFEKPNIDFKENKQLQLRGMAILPEFQKKGFGEILLTEIEMFVVKKGLSLIWFNARENAVGFYEKSNYKKFGIKFDIPAVGFHYVMYKEMK